MRYSNADSVTNYNSPPILSTVGVSALARLLSAEHPKYLSRVVHNTQKRGIVPHLAEEALHLWSAF